MIYFTSYAKSHTMKTKKKMSVYESEIYQDLFNVLTKILIMDVQNGGKPSVDDKVIEYISYALENLSGMHGITKEIFSKFENSKLENKSFTEKNEKEGKVFELGGSNILVDKDKLN